MLLTPEKEKKSKEKQYKNVGMLVFYPTVCANVLGWSLGKEVLLGCILASKRADSDSKRLTKLGTARGGPARPFRRSTVNVVHFFCRADWEAPIRNTFPAPRRQRDNRLPHRRR
ncbi:hypothetical protein PIB30_064640 [Stylosanthes scabra]|uniref:Uncharacterized protein n=1 Tax=Stylosanthes scabra TaxID=79078 RepID=A0ABU6WQ36_9FABA|nr:hypothetical protein [Stylosanthes scabra]